MLERRRERRAEWQRLLRQARDLYHELGYHQVRAALDSEEQPPELPVSRNHVRPDILAEGPGKMVVVASVCEAESLAEAGEDLRWFWSALYAYTIEEPRALMRVHVPEASVGRAGWLAWEWGLPEEVVSWPLA
jgi:hypothetical protein